MKLKRYACVAVLAGLIAGCAHQQPAPLAPADVMYRKAEEAAQPGKFLWWETSNCDEAIPLYQAVIDNYPFSQYAVESQLGIADCHFRDDQWADAIFHYREFEKLHPNHAEIWRVRFNLAEAHHAQSLDYDLDMADIEQAHYYYGKAAEGISPYRGEALEKARKEAELLAKRVLYIARFYERNGELLSALERYRSLIVAFPDLPQAREAYTRAEGLYSRLGETEKMAQFPKPTGMQVN